MSVCPHRVMDYANGEELIIDCRRCKLGGATIFDKRCWSNLSLLLQEYRGVVKVVLDHLFREVFVDKELSILKDLSFSQREFELAVRSRLCSKCRVILSKRSRLLTSCLLEELVEYLSRSLCRVCRENIKESLGYLSREYSGLLRILLDVKPTVIQPGFISSMVLYRVPKDSTLVSSYTIECVPPAKVNLYQLRGKPEKMYFLIPSEFFLPRSYISLIDDVWSRLVEYYPDDASFMKTLESDAVLNN